MSPTRQRRWYPDPVVLLSAAGLVGAWWLVSLAVGLPVILPPPPAVLLSVLRELGSPAFLSAVAVTALRAVLTLVISVLVAIPLGMLAARQLLWERLLRPFMTTVRSVPFISVILLAMVWFTSGRVPLFVALLMVLPLVYESARSGVAGIDAHLFRLFNVHGITGAARVAHLLLPGARTALNGGLRSANGIAWKVTVAAEVISNPRSGIGVQMGEARLFLETERLLAWTLVLIVLSTLSERLISRLTTVRLLPVRRELEPAPAARSAAGPEYQPAGVHLRGLRFGWPGQHDPVFRELSLTLAAGELVAVLGASGVGKSSLLALLADEVRPQAGEIRLGDGERCSVAFQRPALLPWRSAAEHVRILGSDPGRAEQLREIMALPPDIWGNTPDQLSGGMAQRLSLLLACARPGRVLLLDEPLSAIDEQQRQRVIGPLRRAVTTDRRPVVVVLHDAASALELADRVIVLRGRPARIALDQRRHPQRGDWENPSRLHASIREVLDS